MLDILIKDGDLTVGEDGDITLTESIKQAAEIRLRWFFGEWRLGPYLGIDYFESVFVKSPDIPLIRGKIVDALSEINNVDGVKNVEISGDNRNRKATITFELVAGAEVLRDEVEIYV